MNEQPTLFQKVLSASKKARRTVKNWKTLAFIIGTIAVLLLFPYTKMPTLRLLQLGTGPDDYVLYVPLLLFIAVCLVGIVYDFFYNLKTGKRIEMVFSKVLPNIIGFDKAETSPLYLQNQTPEVLAKVQTIKDIFEKSNVTFFKEYRSWWPMSSKTLSLTGWTLVGNNPNDMTLKAFVELVNYGSPKTAQEKALSQHEWEKKGDWNFKTLPTTDDLAQGLIDMIIEVLPSNQKGS